MDDLLADFVTECLESLSELDLAVVRLEHAPDDQATLSLIFRHLHTIKGTCGFLGLERLQKLAHAAETVLDKLRERTLNADAAGISLILAVVDRIRMIVDALDHTHGEPSGDDAALIAALDDLACRGHAEPPDAPAGAETPQFEGSGRNQTIRVGVNILENLITLVSELVLTRNQLRQLLRGSTESSIANSMHRLSQLTSDLHESVLRTRMQPIGMAWNNLPRLVRDLGQELGKPIDLVTSGSQTELDRQVLELIKDPLSHMVRNSADHGLETEAERRALGKPRAGTIGLAARHEGGHIVIEVDDDGCGLNEARIGERALSQGLVGEAALSRMSKAEIHRFIFHPGFSTATTVTSISGRGVGMDVVKTNIERIGGTIDVDSRPGCGSRFRLKIPLTLAIVSALIVGTAGERFAIPQASILEIVLPGSQTGVLLETIDGTQLLRYRDRLLPLISMQRLLRLQGTSADERIVVVITVANQRFGLCVEQVFDTEEIVVKPVAPMIRHIEVFSGNAIIGDGTVIMILDPPGIARQSNLSTNPDALAARPEHALPEQPERSELLLVRAGPGAQKALPLTSVARLEMIPRHRLEVAGSGLVTHYQGGLMPLLALDPNICLDTATQPVLAISKGRRFVGLMVDEILDVASEAMNIELLGDRPGLLGTAIIASKITEIIDTSYWLTRATQNTRPEMLEA